MILGAPRKSGLGGKEIISTRTVLLVGTPSNTPAVNLVDSIGRRKENGNRESRFVGGDHTGEMAACDAGGCGLVRIDARSAE